MTPDERRAALVERVADLVRFNHDPIAIADEAVNLALEEADAKVPTEILETLAAPLRGGDTLSLKQRMALSALVAQALTIRALIPEKKP